MKVLVAEDDEVTRLRLTSLLTKRGYEVVEAEDGVAAWEVLHRDDAPLLAILDWMMPGLDGIEVCRKIRESGKSPYVYIIILTGKTAKHDLIAGMEAGADDYLSKPSDEQELLVRLRAGERVLELQAELRRQASHDALTGIYNRRTILEMLERELARTSRIGTSVGVVLLDIDHFKQINDTHGHRAGDEVLRETAKLLLGTLRPYDSLGRYGGEEFLTVLPGCSDVCGIEVAERMRHCLAEHPVNTFAGRIPITASLGAASAVREEMPNADKLIGAADDALYRAKRSGRNCVRKALRKHFDGYTSVASARPVPPCPA